MGMFGKEKNKSSRVINVCAFLSNCTSITNMHAKSIYIYIFIMLKDAPPPWTS